MSDTVWYYAAGNEQRGPVAQSELSALIGRGEVGPDTLVWCDGMASWATARSSLPGTLVPQGWVDALSVPASGATASAPPIASAQTGAAIGSFQASGAGAPYYHPVKLADVVRTVFGRYATFRGRARRAEFWYWILFTFLIGMVFMGYFFLRVLAAGGQEPDASIFDGVLVIAYMLFALAAFIPGLAVTVRRLHDTGKSGWMALIWFVPIVGPFIVIFFLAQRSEPNDNAYGPA